MKHKYAITALLLAALLCTGCTGQTGPSAAEESQTPVTGSPAAETAAPETEAASSAASEALPAETNSPKQVTQPPVTDPPAVPADSEEINPYGTVTAEGWFTATVRAKLPDYVSDETTERAAVLQLFQDVPFFMILSPEICEQIDVGKTYAFHICEQEITTEKSNLYEDGTLSPDAVIHSYFQIDSVRTPEEDEGGLECWNVTYTPVS